MAMDFPPGLDLKPERKVAFTDMGGYLVNDAAELGRRVDAAFVMVMNGDQAKSVILGPDGLVENMEQGGVDPKRDNQTARGG